MNEPVPELAKVLPTTEVLLRLDNRLMFITSVAEIVNELRAMIQSFDGLYLDEVEKGVPPDLVRLSGLGKMAEDALRELERKRIPVEGTAVPKEAR